MLDSPDNPGGPGGYPHPERAGQADWPDLVALWEASVRATHLFLPETDIAELRPLLEAEYFPAVELWVLRGAGGGVQAFLGVSGERVEMLFVHPRHMGRGLGTRLLRHAIEELGAQEVDVNEQNPRALDFYLRRGFAVAGRSERDGQGRPFPLLHLRLKTPAD